MTKIKLFILWIIFFNLNVAKSQICNSSIKSKYVTLAEKQIGSNFISDLTSHSVVAVKGGFWLGGLANLAGIDKDFYFAKFNDTGKLLFFKTVGLSTDEGGFSIRLAATPSGGIIITGQNYNNSTSSNLGAIVSIDNTGNLKWYRKTPSSGNQSYLDAIRAVMVDPNGDVIIAGDAQQYSSLNYSRVLVVKLDSNGNDIFTNQINLSLFGNNHQAHPTQIQSTPYGYLIGGWITSNVNPFLLLVNKKTGASIKSFFLDGLNNHSQDKLIYTPSGKVYLAGFTSAKGTPDAWVAAVDLNQEIILWQIGFATTPGARDYFNHAYLENDLIYMSMQSEGLGNGSRQGFIVVDTNGNFVSGNSIYFASREFKTSNAGMDFDVLNSGGTVFFGQDDYLSTPHLNFAIMSPCDYKNCANHIQDYTTFNTILSPVSLSAIDHFQGKLTTEIAKVNKIEMGTTIECLIPNLSNNYWLLNSFSPGNNDGFNDVFKIGYEGREFYYNLMIYNRWGELVFETQNANIKDESKFWNGKVMNTGPDCPAGSYFVLYQLYLDGTNNPPKEIHGVITLIRE